MRARGWKIYGGGGWGKRSGATSRAEAQERGRDETLSRTRPDAACTFYLNSVLLIQ